MKRSPIRKLFINSLVALNDQLCYFLMADRELERQLENFSPAVSKLFTSDVFAKNEFAPKIHVTIEKLPEFKIRNQAFTFGAYFSTSYEIASGYYEAALALIKDCHPKKFKSVTKGTNRKGQKITLPIENAYYETLKESKCELPDIELIHTLSYLRFRRNNFIHINGTISESFEYLITSQGEKLNMYWGNTSNKIDFSSKTLLDLGKDETIEILKLLRITIEELDNALIKSLDVRWVLHKFILDEFKSKPFKINPQTTSDFISKAKKRIQLEYGLECSTEEVQEVFDKIKKTL